MKVRIQVALQTRSVDVKPQNPAANHDPKSKKHSQRFTTIRTCFWQQNSFFSINKIKFLSLSRKMNTTASIRRLAWDDGLFQLQRLGFGSCW